MHLPGVSIILGELGKTLESLTGNFKTFSVKANMKFSCLRGSFGLSPRLTTYSILTQWLDTSLEKFSKPTCVPFSHLPPETSLVLMHLYRFLSLHFFSLLLK